VSIEEIVAKTLKGERALWEDLACEVELQMVHARAIQPLYTFNRTPGDSFRIKFVDTTVFVSWRGGTICWTHSRTFGERGDGVRPVFGNGSMDLAMNGYRLNGQQFRSVTEAALFLVNLLTENPTS
jgi:hypothetical protein